MVKNPPCHAGDPSSIPGLGRSPKKETATHSSVLAWRILWTEKTGGLQSLGSQRVGYNWSDLACMHGIYKGEKKRKIIKESWKCFHELNSFRPGFPGGSEFKASACNAGDLGSIPELEGYPGEGNGYPLQYSCLENPLDRGAWRATVPGVTKSQTRLCTLNHRKETVTFTVDTCEKKMFILSHPNYFMVGRYFMLPLLIVCLNTSALCLLVSAVLLFVSSCSPSDDSSPFPPFSSLFKCELLSDS